MSTATSRAQEYARRLQATIAATSSEAIVELAEAVRRTASAGGFIFVAGNGGSASTASHFANDLTMTGVRAGTAMRVQALTDCQALTTGIANDRSFEQAIADQLAVIAREGDLLILISASGNSPNLIRACTQATQVGARVVAIVGFDGGELRRLADITVHTPTASGDYGVAEDAHLFVNHAVAELLALGDG